MSLLTLFTRSHVQPRDVVKVVLPPTPLTDAEKAVRELELLIRQCKEAPLKIYKERFGCSRMELCTELNGPQKATIAQYQAELEAELATLCKAV